VTRSLSSNDNSRKVYSSRNLKAIAARWNARADSWDESLQDPACHLNEDDAYRRFTSQVKRVIARRRRFCAKHGVIDVGCGTGLVLEEIIDTFSWGIGVDISPKMIQLACAKHVNHTKFMVGDCFDLPSFCPKAGAIISRGVLLSHYGSEQSYDILSAARAALVPGGFVVFDFLNEAARHQHTHAPENKTWFSREEIRLIARRAGFSSSKILGHQTRRVLLLLAET
jgi:SAM-dependent methyltransferase